MPSSPKGVHLTTRNMRTPLKLSSTTSNESTPWASTPDKQYRKKIPDLALPTEPKKEKNQYYAGFDMDVVKWKKNTNTVFVRKHNIEEGGK